MIFRGKYKKSKHKNRKIKQPRPAWFKIEQEAGTGDRCGCIVRDTKD